MVREEPKRRMIVILTTLLCSVLVYTYGQFETEAMCFTMSMWIVNLVFFPGFIYVYLKMYSVVLIYVNVYSLDRKPKDFDSDRGL